MKIRPNTIFTILFFSTIFLTSIVPVRDTDIWFHIKAGEYFFQYGLIFHDVFSFTAEGRAWIPYEWLFQIGVYLIQEGFGFDSLKYFTAFFATLQVGLIYLILRRILKLDLFISMSLSFFFLASVFEFVTPRPHIVAYTFFFATLYLALEYMFHSKQTDLKSIFRIKNILLLSLPITWAWSNIHGSLFLSFALFGAFSFISFLNYYFTKEKRWLSKGVALAIFSLLNALITILPPLGFDQYRLLIKFFTYREVLTSFIAEWTPLYTNDFGYKYYIAVTAATFIPLFIYLIKQKDKSANLWLVPLLPFPFLAFTASRNVLFGFLSLTILIGFLFSKVSFLNNKKGAMHFLLPAIVIILIASQIWIISEKKVRERLYYPVKAVEFIKQYSLKGNMFNEYGYGGYMLYHLYPEHKVFYDGRTEMYLCCEMPDTLELALKKYAGDEQFKPTMDWLWNKYNISYVIMRSQKHSVLRKMGRILTDDPNWSLVYWDDDAMIYIRHDGKNDQLVKDLGVTAATPYNQNPFREGMEDKAMAEYQRMIKIVDSSKSRNAIGYILLKKGDFMNSDLEFQRAAALDVTNESPLMNLAELAARDKNYLQAIEFYEKALTLAPDRGLIYIRLGQLYLQNGEDLTKAKDIWQTGVGKTVDEDAKKRLQELLAM